MPEVSRMAVAFHQEKHDVRDEEELSPQLPPDSKQASVPDQREGFLEDPATPRPRTCQACGRIGFNAFPDRMHWHHRLPLGITDRWTFVAEPGDAALPRLGSQEGQQVFVELVLVRAGEAVGRARIDLQGRVLDDLRGEQGRVTDWHDLVVVAVDDQGWNVELLEVFR